MMTNKYLAHFGIKGQKWGVRRFQNSDGTLTEEGKRRHSSDFIKKHETGLRIAGSVALISAGNYISLKYCNVPYKQVLMENLIIGFGTGVVVNLINKNKDK